MNFLRDAIEAVRNADFSILGHVYLGPGNFLRLSPPQYLMLMCLGSLWLVAIGYLVWRLCAARIPDATGSGERGLRTRLAVCFAVFYAAWGAYVTLAYPPTTDEPHYLMVAHSIAADGDIRLGQNYAAADFRCFFPAREIDPHALLLPDGEMYSQHTAGLPLGLLPAYVLAGRWGILLVLALLGGVLVGALYSICRRFKVPAYAAFLCSTAAGTTVPLVLGATLVFTEAPAALLLALGLLSGGTGWGAAACAALLPWLHPRYALLSLGLAAALWRGSSNRKEFLLKWAIAGTLSAAMFFSIYEGPALTAVLNVLTEKYPARIEDLGAASLLRSSFSNPLIGAVGKFLDGDFGAIPYAPWLIVAIPGVACCLSIRGFPHATLLLAGGAYFLATCLFRNWSGSTYPARTLLPLLPLAVPYLGHGIHWAFSRGRPRLAAWSLMGVSWAIALGLTAFPIMRYTSGRDWLEVKMGMAALIMPRRWLPSFGSEDGWLSLIILGIASVLVLAMAKRRRKP